MLEHTTIQLERISLGADGMHLRVKLRLGEEPIALILDTGASATVFDLELIRELEPRLVIHDSDSVSAGLGTASMQSFRAQLAVLWVGAFKLTAFEAALLDLSHINVAYVNAGMPVIHGVLGNDILEKYHAVIDYAGMNLRLTRKTGVWHRLTGQ